MLIQPERLQSNGFVERVQRTILDKCWEPAFARYLVRGRIVIRRELERYVEVLGVGADGFMHHLRTCDRSKGCHELTR